MAEKNIDEAQTIRELTRVIDRKQDLQEYCKK